MTILSCESISMYFGGLKAVENVSFDVEEGQIFSIIGPNGAGKTTLFNVLTGFLRATRGKAVFKGENLIGKKPHQIADHGITRTYQHTSVFPALTALENARVAYHRNQSGNVFDSIFRTKRWHQDEQRSSEKAYEVLKFLEMEQFDQVQANNLGYGQLRLLEIAVALCLEPTLLLLDEPAAGMNPEEAQKLMTDIVRIRERRVTIILVEHNMRVVMGISDQVMALNYGCVISKGTPSEVANDQKVIEAYLGGGSGYAQS